MRPLDVLFTSPQQRLLGAVLANPERDFGTLELLRHIGSSRSAGAALIQKFVDGGLLRERRLGNQRRLSANPDFFLYPELRRIVLKTVGVVEPLARALRPLRKRIKEGFVFGSVARGEDNAGSDIDLALVGDLDLFAVSPLIDIAEAELGRQVHANIYSTEEWARDTDAVIRSIRNGPKLDLMEALHAKAR
jgi:uncharacterized protein